MCYVNDMDISPKATYTKLFQKILTSTIWGEDDRTRIVWITMLAMCDSSGCVLSSLPGLARIANVPIVDAANAVEKFLAPDPYSSSPEYEGRRIEVIPGGWRLLNHAKYKALMSLEHRRAYNASKQKEYRMKARGKPLPGEVEYDAALKRGATQEELEEIERRYQP